MSEQDIPRKKPAMTQEQCENYIMLKGQGAERWFEVRILDPEVADEPVMKMLMETVSDMIFQGMLAMPFTEVEHARVASKQPGPGLAIVDAKGKPIPPEPDPPGDNAA